MKRIYKFFKFSFPLFFNHPLWRTNPLHPLSRFIFLQTLFYSGKKSVTRSWINGLKLPIKKGETGLTGNYYFGLHEFNSMAFVLHLLRQDDLFLDIGANLGSYSLLSSGVAGSKSIAFEPVPQTFLRLNENIKINKLEDKVEAHMIALTSPLMANSSETLFFSNDRDTENSFVDTNYEGKKISITTSTLDIESKNYQPVLLKIDVEGYEHELIKGAKETLLKKSLLGIIIENRSVEVSELIANYGFEPVFYNALTRTFLQDLEPDVNLIWIKRSKIEEIQKRVLESGPIKIGKKVF